MRKFINFSLILCILFMVSGCANLMEEKNTENRIVIDMRQSRAAISWDEVSSWCVLIEKIPENVNVTKDILDDYSSLGKFLEKNYPNPNLEELKPSQKYYESEELDPASYLVVIGLFKDSRKDDPFAFGAGIVNVEAGKTAEADILVRCVAERSNTDLFSIVWMMKTPDPRFKDFYVYSGAYFVKENDSSKIYLVYSNGQGKYWKQLMHTDVQVTVTGCEYAFCSKENPNGFVIKYDEAQNGIYDGSMLYVRDDGADIEKLNASAPMTDTTFVNEDNGFKKRDDGGNSTSVSLENLLDTVWITPSYESINGYDAFKGLYMTVESGKVRIYDVIANDSTYWLYDNESCQNLTITYDVSGEIKILSKDITKAEFCYNPSTGSIEAYSQGLQYIQLKDELIKYPQVQYDESFINKEFGFKETSGGSGTTPAKSTLDIILGNVWLEKEPSKVKVSNDYYYAYKGLYFSRDGEYISIYEVYKNYYDGCWKLHSENECVDITLDGSMYQISKNGNDTGRYFTYSKEKNRIVYNGQKEYVLDESADISGMEQRGFQTDLTFMAQEESRFEKVDMADNIVGIWIKKDPDDQNGYCVYRGYSFEKNGIGRLQIFEIRSNRNQGGTCWKTNVCDSYDVEFDGTGYTLKGSEGNFIPVSYDEDKECININGEEILYMDKGHKDLIDALDNDCKDFITTANGFDNIAGGILGKTWVSDTPQTDGSFYYSMGYFFAEENGKIKMYDVVFNGNGQYWKEPVLADPSVEITAENGACIFSMSNGNKKTFALNGDILSLKEGSSTIEYRLQDIKPEAICDAKGSYAFINEDNGFRKCLSEDELKEFLGNVYLQEMPGTINENGKNYEVYKGYYIEESSSNKVNIYSVFANGSENGGWLVSKTCEDACICKQDDTYCLFTTFGGYCSTFSYQEEESCINFCSSDCILNEDANKDSKITERLFNDPKCFDQGNFNVITQ